PMRATKTISKGSLRAIRFFSGKIDCPKCQGTRLNPDTLSRTIHGKTVLEILKMPIIALQQFVAHLSGSLDNRQAERLQALIYEIQARLSYFMKIGLSTLMPHLDIIPSARTPVDNTQTNAL